MSVETPLSSMLIPFDTNADDVNAEPHSGTLQALSHETLIRTAG